MDEHSTSEYWSDRSRDLKVVAIFGGVTVLLLLLLLTESYGAVLTVLGWVGFAGCVGLTTPFVLRAIRRGPDVVLSDEGVTVFRLVDHKSVAWLDVHDICPPRHFSPGTPLAATVIPLSLSEPTRFFVPIPRGADPASFRSELISRWDRALGRGDPDDVPPHV